MNVKKILRKMGISDVAELEFTTKEKFVKLVSTTISSFFENYGIKYSDIYLKLINTKMYVGSFSTKTQNAVYLYKNQALYFRDGIDLANLDKQSLVEVIHRIQDIRNSRGKIVKFGLCQNTETNIVGVALNEAATQYLAYKILGLKKEEINAYNTNIKAISTDYPCITNILEQMVFITGEMYLVQSVLNCTKDFKKSFKDKCDKMIYEDIIKITDKMYDNKNKITNFNNKILFGTKIKESRKQKMREKVREYSRCIRQDYFNVQKQIYMYYFSKKLMLSEKVEDLEMLKVELGKYKDLVGVSNLENENSFNMYCLDFYYKIEKKMERITRKDLAVQDNSKFGIIKRSLKKLSGNSSYDFEDNDK